MMKKTLLLFIGSVVLCLGGTPVMADLNLEYHLTTADLVYDGASTLTITESAGSVFDVLKKDSTLSPPTIDSARIEGGSAFDFTLELTLSQLGLNSWSAAGTLMFTDISGTNVVEAAVKSTSITLVGPLLLIQGGLAELNPPSVLVPASDPWEFAGSGEAVAADEDGIANHVTVANSLSYDSGTVLSIQFVTSAPTLDDFFKTQQFEDGGEVKGMITPVPAAMLLGMLGLGTAGLRLRKRA